MVCLGSDHTHSKNPKQQQQQQQRQQQQQQHQQHQQEEQQLLFHCTNTTTTNTITSRRQHCSFSSSLLDSCRSLLIPFSFNSSPRSTTTKTTTTTTTTKAATTIAVLSLSFSSLNNCQKEHEDYPNPPLLLLLSSSASTSRTTSSRLTSRIGFRTCWLPHSILWWLWLVRLVLLCFCNNTSSSVVDAAAALDLTCSTSSAKIQRELAPLPLRCLGNLQPGMRCYPSLIQSVWNHPKCGTRSSSFQQLPILHNNPDSRRRVFHSSSFSSSLAFAPTARVSSLFWPITTRTRTRITSASTVLFAACPKHQHSRSSVALFAAAATSFPDLPPATAKRIVAPTLVTTNKNNYNTIKNNNNNNKNGIMSPIVDEANSVGNTEEVHYYTLYEQWVRRLYMTNLFHPVKLGLRNMEAIYKALGNPLDQIAVLHIAGTNGKGSVVYKLAQTLQLLHNNNNNDGEKTKNKVGMFVSPHISSFRERMQVNGNCITEDEVVELLPPIYDICIRQDIPATFFEITTALAFSFFAKRQVNVVVLETGLGGRLDATNVLTNQCIVMAIITSIGLEHTRILGNTIAEIAREKGGIIKPNRPVLVGPNVPHDVLRQCAQDKQASAYYICDDLVPSPTSLASLNDYDQENARIARAAMILLANVRPDLCHGLTDDILVQGTSVRPSCRFEQIQVPHPATSIGDDKKDGSPATKTTTVILDVAHNPPAMDYLVRRLQSTFDSDSDNNNDPVTDTKKKKKKKRTLFRMVVGMSSDKDLYLCGQAVLKAVNGDASRIHLVEAAHPRAAKLEDILGAAAAAAKQQGEGHPTTTTTTSSWLDSCRYNLEDRSITYQIQQALDLIAAARTNKRSDDDDDDNEDTPDEILVICGSVFLMAEAREALGFDEPRDSKYIAEVAGAGSRHGQENFGNSGGTTTLASSAASSAASPSSP